jgi:hypothetical protein
MTEDECHWTQAQKDAYDLIERTIREHFDAGVFYVSAEINDKQDEHRGSYHGGRCVAIGLHRMAEHKLLNKPADDVE